MIHGGEIYDKTVEYDLSVNLNPMPCPEAVKASLERAVKDVGKYPDMSQRDFAKAVAEAENKLSGGSSLTSDNVLGGNGASELIFAIIRLISPKKAVLPAPGFYGYRHGLNALKDVNVREHILREEEGFALTERFAENIDDDTDLVILTNPNNPTGRAIEPQVLDCIMNRCRQTGTYVLVDECFLHLSEVAESAVRYFAHGAERLFIVNAYTKLFSIPGVRIGYCMSSAENIRKLRGFVPEWNMSVFALEAGRACAEYLVNTDFVRDSRLLVREKRQKLTKLLEDKKIKVYPSDTCFVLVKAEDDLYEKLLYKKVLIRNCSNFSNLEKGYYRIAVAGSHFLSSFDFS